MRAAARSERSELEKNAPVRFKPYPETSSANRDDASPFTALSANSGNDISARRSRSNRRKSVMYGANAFMLLKGCKIWKHKPIPFAGPGLQGWRMAVGEIT
jgi:hypothetical protein